MKLESRARGRVLVLDDEKNIVIVLRTILEKRGFAVDGFTSSLDALQVVQNIPKLAHVAANKRSLIRIELRAGANRPIIRLRRIRFRLLRALQFGGEAAAAEGQGRHEDEERKVKN